MSAYYNEIDPFAAAWLRELIKAGHIAPGEVDERSIEDVEPRELAEYKQCHFFAGIGGWSYALRLAGWPDDKPCWTGSCPCQPFSSAGKGAGFADDRHLWPAFDWLIDQRRPVVVFGEQVASPDGRAWLDVVSTDLEGKGYAVGAVAAVASGFGSPQLRQRLYWVADAYSGQLEREPVIQGLERDGSYAGRAEGLRGAAARGHASRLADSSDCAGFASKPRAVERGFPAEDGGDSAVGVPSPTNGVWRDADWLFCRDDRWRPVQPGTFPLADGVSNRVGRLRGYGNAIVPQQAAAFIAAFADE